MQQPDVHRDYVRSRHSDLLRVARAGELATRIGEARREERRTFLARLRHTSASARPAATG
ncbi:MAG: hypothetical protein ACRDOG_11815 [Gaiellaceae bacterium]